MEALIELQALRLPGAVELCETSAKRSPGRRARSSAERSLGGDVHGAVTLIERGSILMFQTILAVSPTRKAVVADRHNYADRHNPITYVTLRTPDRYTRCFENGVRARAIYAQDVTVARDMMSSLCRSNYPLAR